jgi:quercetin dioxygenase-like cupin family protein
MPEVTRLDQVVPFALHNAEFYPLSSPSRGGTELAVWQLRLSPGAAGAPHVIDREEVFVCVSGEVLIRVDDDAEPARLLAGDTLAVPPGSLVSVGSGSDGAAVTVCTRAGLSAKMTDGTVLSPPWAS